MSHGSRSRGDANSAGCGGYGGGLNEKAFAAGAIRAAEHVLSSEQQQREWGAKKQVACFSLVRQATGRRRRRGLGVRRPTSSSAARLRPTGKCARASCFFFCLVFLRATDSSRPRFREPNGHAGRLFLRGPCCCVRGRHARRRQHPTRLLGVYRTVVPLFGRCFFFFFLSFCLAAVSRKTSASTLQLSFAFSLST